MNLIKYIQINLEIKILQEMFTFMPIKYMKSKIILKY